MGKKTGWIKKASRTPEEEQKIYKTAKNLNITDDIKTKINESMPIIMQDILSIKKGEKDNRKIYPRNIPPRNIVFTDPYSKVQRTISIIYRTSGSSSLEGHMETSDDDQIIKILIPEDRLVSTKNPDGTTNYAQRQKIPANPFNETDVYNVLFHEISHFIDPKTAIDHKKGLADSADQGQTAYYTDPKEVDAYQSEITNAIINNLKTNPNNYNVLTTWLRGGGILDLTQFLVQTNAINAFNFWNKNNPDIMKKLRQRIYHGISQSGLSQPNNPPKIGFISNYIGKLSKNTYSKTYLTAEQLQKEAGYKDMALAVMLFLSGWAAKDITNEIGVKQDELDKALQNQETVAKAEQMKEQMGNKFDKLNTMKPGGIAKSPHGQVGTGISGISNQEAVNHNIYQYKGN